MERARDVGETIEAYLRRQVMEVPLEEGREMQERIVRRLER